MTQQHHRSVIDENPAVIVLENARWHTNRKREILAGIHLLFLPAYSPALQPAERLWLLVDEAIENRTFHSIEQLEEVIVERCVQLTQHPEYVQRYTDYHWWPKTQT